MKSTITIKMQYQDTFHGAFNEAILMLCMLVHFFYELRQNFKIFMNLNILHFGTEGVRHFGI